MIATVLTKVGSAASSISRISWDFETRSNAESREMVASITGDKVTMTLGFLVGM
jgi:hypothetical protein